MLVPTIRKAQKGVFGLNPNLLERLVRFSEVWGTNVARPKNFDVFNLKIVTKKQPLKMTFFSKIYYIGQSRSPGSLRWLCYQRCQ